MSNKNDPNLANQDFFGEQEELYWNELEEVSEEGGQNLVSRESNVSRKSKPEVVRHLSNVDEIDDSLFQSRTNLDDKSERSNSTVQKVEVETNKIKKLDLDLLQQENNILNREEAETVNPFSSRKINAREESSKEQSSKAEYKRASRIEEEADDSLHTQEIELEDVDLSNQQGINVTALDNDPLMVGKLSLVGNNLMYIDNSIASFENLLYLDISNNNIESIHNLRYLPNLQFLYVRNNKLKVLPVLFSLTSLVELDLAGNNLRVNKSFVQVLRYNPNLQSLFLQGNPDYMFEQVKYCCLDYLQHLTRLDGHVIFKEKVVPKIGSKVTINLVGGKHKKVRNVREYVKLGKEGKIEMAVNVKGKEVCKIWRTTRYYNIIARRNNFI